MTLRKEIDKLKEENETVLHLPRYDKRRKEVLDRNSKKIEALTSEMTLITELSGDLRGEKDGSNKT